MSTNPKKKDHFDLSTNPKKKINQFDLSTNGFEPLLIAQSDLETDALTNSAKWTYAEAVIFGFKNSTILSHSCRRIWFFTSIFRFDMSRHPRCKELIIKKNFECLRVCLRVLDKTWIWPTSWPYEFWILLNYKLILSFSVTWIFYQSAFGAFSVGCHYA